jgi:hypothetical protein
MPKAKRSEFAAFLNTGTTAVPVWSRMGKGITEQTINYNPTVTNEKYIDEDAPTPEVDSYAPTIPTPQTAMPGDAVFDCIDKLRQDRATGAAAVKEILLVNIYDSTTAGEPVVTTYTAEKQEVAIQIDDFGGEADLGINYTLNFRGTPAKGTVVITAGAPVFTAA